MFNFYVGIDVGRYKLDLYDTINNQQKLIKNKEEDIINYIDYLSKSIIEKDEVLITIDLTGGYEKTITHLLFQNGFKNIVLADGFKVKNFTKSTRHNRAKTDAVDCKILIEYSKYFITQNQLDFYTPLDEDRELITQLYGRVENLKDNLQKEKNHLKQPNLLPFTKKMIIENISFLEKQISDLKDEIKRIINSNEEIKIIYNSLIAEKGIKDEISLFLIVKLKELGKIQRKQLASICGVAPISHDSGKSVRGHRYVKGGRKDIKSKLYFCVLSMIRYNTQFKNKMAEFVSRGKNKKVALIALARKLITQLNAMVRNALQKTGFIN
jgi:transposase